MCVFVCVISLCNYKGWFSCFGSKNNKIAHTGAIESISEKYPTINWSDRSLKKKVGGSPGSPGEKTAQSLLYSRLKCNNTKSKSSGTVHGGHGDSFRKYISQNKIGKRENFVSVFFPFSSFSFYTCTPFVRRLTLLHI